MVAFRVIEAAGAAFTTPTSIALLAASFPPVCRGGAVRALVALGGFASTSWRWIFLVNVAIGVVAMHAQSARAYAEGALGEVSR
ncbi:MAG: hypothetical protein ACRDHZ_18245, partial [Ktedonobacteraceae bacterium]